MLRFMVQITPSGPNVVSEDGLLIFMLHPEGQRFTPRSARLFAGWLSNTEPGRRYLEAEDAASKARVTGRLGDNGEVVLDN